MQSIGIGLRSQHLVEFVNTKPKVAYIEVHAENYFGDSIELDLLQELAKDYSIFLHCIGCSLGSAEPIAQAHLKGIVALVKQLKPTHLSDHIAWSVIKQKHTPDLLPVLRNAVNTQCLIDNIDRMQQATGMPLLVENPAHYLQLQNYLEEPNWLANIAAKTGCKLLLDLNNIIVSSFNLSENPFDYLEQIKPEIVGQYHLAGHSFRKINQSVFAIDSHNTDLSKQLIDLYQYSLTLIGKRPTIVERDSQLPELNELLVSANSVATLPAATKVPATVTSTAKQVAITLEPIDTIESLQQWQSQFFESIKQPDVDSLNPYGDAFLVYRNNYQRNCSGALSDCFISVYLQIGERQFNRLAYQFIALYPPTTANIFEYGQQFVGYIQSSKHGVWLHDLARLDWAMHWVHFQPNITINLTDNNVAINGQQGLQLMTSHYAIDDLRQSIRRQQKPITTPAKLVAPLHLVVFKNYNFDLQCVRVSEAQFAILQKLQQSPNFATAIAELTQGKLEQDLAITVKGVINLLYKTDC